MAAVLIIAGALSATPACLLTSTAYETAGSGATSASGGATSAGGGPGGSTNKGGAGGAGGTGDTSTTTGGTGGLPPEACDSFDDCVDSDPCTSDACDTNVCVHFPKKNSTVDADTGDCVLVECDENGFATTVDDPDDTPDDGNPCTIDSCDGMQPVHESQDGQLQIGQCGEVNCNSGTPDGPVMDNRWACVDYDSNNQDCAAPVCTATVCVGPEVKAPAGWPCVKNGSDATCDGNGPGSGSCKF
jgi:hypothetical protein